MADPTPYAPSYSFTNFQTNSPSSPLPAVQVDNELDSIATAVAGLVAAIKDVRRSDGALKNNIVTFDSLALGLQLTFDPTNGQIVADAILDAQASAAAALASQIAAANSAAAALTQALAAAASAASVDLTLYLPKNGNLAGLGSKVTSRANLDLGTVATFNVGTAANNIIQLDGSAKLPAVDGSQLTNIDVLMVGAVVWVPSTAAPAGTIKLNGALLSRVTFSRLWTYAQASGNLQNEAGWASANAAFSNGDLATTFRVPDLRGEFIRNFDDGRGVDSGRGIGGVQLDALKDHTHSYGAGADGFSYAPSAGAHFGFVSTAQTTGGSSLGAATETRPRNIPLLACIKY